MSEFSDEQWDTFFSAQSTFTTDGNLEGTKIDFSPLSFEQDKTDTMVIAVIPVHEATMFVKLTGSLTGIKRYQSQFQMLCLSIKAAE